MNSNNSQPAPAPAVCLKNVEFALNYKSILQVLLFNSNNMAAVEVRDGFKYYGRSANPKIILNFLNMNVPKGSM